MGLLKAGLGAAGGVMADQWKEFIYCESMPADVLACKGSKRTGGRSSNTRGEDNVISNGSVIAVNDGQGMLVVQNGKIIEVALEPGEFVFDTGSEPSVFSGNLGDSIKETFAQYRQPFHLWRRRGQGPARLLYQHQGDHRQQVRHRLACALPRGR